MLLLSVSLANASAYYFLDSNIRAIGRGGAFVAGADDVSSAQYYNPAALIHLDRSQAHVETWLVSQAISFDRADEAGPDGQLGTDDDLTFAPVANEAPPMIVPNLGAGLRFKPDSIFKNTAVGIGLYTPSAPTMEFPTDGAQRYVLTRAMVWQAWAGPSVAQRVTDWLTLGAGVNYSFLRVEEDLALTTAQTESAQDDRSFDVDVALKAWDTAQVSWNAGALIQPVDWLEVGIAVVPATKYLARGSLAASFNPDHSLRSQLEGCEAEDGAEPPPCTFTDDDVTVLVALPWTFRGGVQVHPHDKVAVEADFTYTTWSSLQELRVSDMDLVVDVNALAESLGQVDAVVTDDVVIPTGFTNAWSVRAGGDWRVTDWGRVSLGGHYETSAVRDALQSVAVVDGSKFGFGLGASVRIARRVQIDAALSQQYLASRTITDSEVHQITVNALSGEIAPGKVVGNGDFKSHLTLGGLGATVFFGGAAEPAAP